MTPFFIRQSLVRTALSGISILLIAGCGALPNAQAQEAPQNEVGSEVAIDTPAHADVMVPGGATLDLGSGEAPAQEAGPVAPAALAQASLPALPALPLVAVPSVLTVPQTEGPYFKAGSPQRTSLLEPGMEGTRLILQGRVLTATGAPVANAKVDFWQTDNAGAYDNSGYRLRGYVLTDAKGVYVMETILPGLYPGRTRHIHVKVQAPGGPVLTSQLYVPEEAGNSRDGIYNPALLMRVQERIAQRVVATFDFAVRA